MKSLLTRSRNATFNSSDVVMHRAGNHAGILCLKIGGGDEHAPQFQIANEFS